MEEAVTAACHEANLPPYAVIPVVSWAKAGRLTTEVERLRRYAANTNALQRAYGPDQVTRWIQRSPHILRAKLEEVRNAQSSLPQPALL